MTHRIRPIEIRDVAACQAIVRENWNDEVARRFAADVSHVWAMDMDESRKPLYYFAVDTSNQERWLVSPA
jgi:hypothetical protein